MYLIDIERKGNVIRCYFGDEIDVVNRKPWGDDWGDRPYQHNAGPVYEEYIKGVKDFAIPFDAGIYEPQDDGDYYSKEDLLYQLAPCIVLIPRYDVMDGSQWWEFSQACAYKYSYKIYLGEEDRILSAKIKDCGGVCL